MKSFTNIFLLISSLLLAWCDLSAADLRLHFIAVGHGDAILIEADGRGIALVDAGLPEAGWVLLEYLRTLGIKRLEHLFVTHTHDDHIGGVPIILDSLEVGIIHHTGMISDWETALTFDRYIKSGKWLLDTVDVGDIPISLGDLTVEILNPQKEETAGRRVDPNPNSMVLMVTHGEVKILLTADIDRKREKKLIRQFGPHLRSNAMKASHHASGSGNGKEFLEAVQPEVIVVTVGPNKWGYPAERTMKRLRKFCPRVLRTDEVGTVILTSDGKSVTVSTPGSTEP